jgi:amidase
MAKSAQDLADLMDIIADPAQIKITGGGYRAMMTRSWDKIRVGVIRPEGWVFDLPFIKAGT